MAVTYYHSDAIRLSLVVILVLLLGLKFSESWLVGEEGWLADYYPGMLAIKVCHQHVNVMKLQTSTTGWPTTNRRLMLQSFCFEKHTGF